MYAVIKQMGIVESFTITQYALRIIIGINVLNVKAFLEFSISIIRRKINSRTVEDI